MTVTLGFLDQSNFRVRPVEPPEPVFVRDMPQPRPADHAPHLGAGDLMAWLDPIRPGGARYAAVRRPTGRILTVEAFTVCSATNVAPIRFRPGIHGDRSAVA